MTKNTERIAECENLIIDWDFEKNNIDPKIISSRSNKKAFWKCHICGYCWEAKISNRYYGRHCPACSGRALYVGHNDLATTHKELSKEWDLEKNYPLKPSDVTRGMNKNVWWICPIGHSYQATINKRTSGNGTGCPICNRGRQTSFREQALFYYVKQMYPNAINGYRADFLGNFEIDIYIPDFRVGIEYDGEAWHKEDKRQREKSKYQLCKENGIKLYRVREKMVEKDNSHIADGMISIEKIDNKEYFEFLIHNVLQMICFGGIYWKKPIDVNIERDRFKIIKCAMNLKKNFESEYPDLAKEWHPTKNEGLKPFMFRPKSNFKAWWICPLCNNEYEMSIGHRANGSKCPKCAVKLQIEARDKKYIEEVGSIVNPLLLREWNYEKNNPLTPKDFARSSEKSVWWKCEKCGYEWKSRISNREHGKGCPCCANRVVVKGVNDLETQYPQIAKEWDYDKNYPVKPSDIISGSSKYFWWICPNCGNSGNSYKAPPHRRTGNNSGCRKCSDRNNAIELKKRRLQEKGSFADNYPELLDEYLEKNTIKPNEILSSCSEKVWWKCKVCGHEWQTSPYVRSKGHGCPECAIEKVKISKMQKKSK